MEGNEPEAEVCIKCKTEFHGDNGYYKCDLCFGSVHKDCVNLTSSEVRCMPLQKRVLLLICDECKQLIARMPYMVKMMEEIKRESPDLKANYRKDTYANVLKNTTSAPDSINKPSLPTITIRPKSQQNIGKNKEELINPCEINVGIKNINEPKKGNIVLKCDTEQELERLKKSAESKLKGKYEVNLPKKMLPKIKIVGYGCS
ncbi:unnamed protein product [Acanthoscelides obtectus]|uniref:Uncharacterized protein n=1 Tax=Acanthoscelides obtectus TaxID=200917 RepID=A0A9P0VUR6_ACAOB|nr:unnamed protein product [Acanthoscelides obtectus]CAH2020567.1 unnamed protein product [Acanthoscelides obtectus]CAK1641414.1 hypothetical protein AOBTE_LOCUS12384 [Acanthoscelides obtectus]CAK1641540.1 hypothetical protein AOBTE_LOCUS12470 [Acanthoscelides obtectus]